MTQEMKDQINTMGDMELAELIAYAQEVRKVKKAEVKEHEKELAKACATLIPSDYKEGEKVMVKYYNDWFPGTVKKVNAKSIKVEFYKKDRKTGVVSMAEDLKTTDKIMKIEDAVWEVENAKYAA